MNKGSIELDRIRFTIYDFKEVESESLKVYETKLYFKSSVQYMQTHSTNKYKSKLINIYPWEISFNKNDIEFYSFSLNSMYKVSAWIVWGNKYSQKNYIVVI